MRDEASPLPLFPPHVSQRFTSSQADHFFLCRLLSLSALTRSHGEERRCLPPANPCTTVLTPRAGKSRGISFWVHRSGNSTQAPDAAAEKGCHFLIRDTHRETDEENAIDEAERRANYQSGLQSQTPFAPSLILILVIIRNSSHSSSNRSHVRMDG